jgi:ABC-type antimicrobial peptide transport system permease subunit
LQQCLVESVLLAVMGAVSGLLVAYLCLPVLIRLIPVSWLTVNPEQIHLNVKVFGVVLSLATAVGIAFGLGPALQSSRTDLATALNASSFRHDGSERPSWWRRSP